MQIYVDRKLVLRRVETDAAALPARSTVPAQSGVVVDAAASPRRLAIHGHHMDTTQPPPASGWSWCTYNRDQMGHRSIRVTVDTYGHLVPGGNKAAVDRLDDAPDATARNPAATATRGS
jgi:hypothetical protein